MTDIILIAVSIVGAVFGCLAFLLAAHAVIGLEAIKRSTHSVLYQPAPDMDYSDKATEEALNRGEIPLEFVYDGDET